MLGFLFIQSYKKQAKKVIQTIDTWVKKKTNQFSFDTPLKRRTISSAEINTLENMRTERPMLGFQIDSPVSDLKRLGKRIEEEEEEGELSSIPDENDPRSYNSFEVSPLPKSLTLAAKNHHKDKKHDIL